MKFYWMNDWRYSSQISWIYFRFSTFNPYGNHGFELWVKLIGYGFRLEYRSKMIKD
jgi:hypothetical protein